MTRWLILTSIWLGQFLAEARPGEPPLRDRIDQQIQAGWTREKVAPAPPADDATFLRRVYLDLGGTVPTGDEARQFLADADPAKRGKLIDRLLDEPRYAIHQASVWDLVLFGRNPPNPEATRTRPAFQKWLREKFARNEPYDKWVRELLAAEGNAAEHGAPLFYVQFRAQPEETMVAVSRIFLGTQLQCAQCHDHPNESWTQRDFYGMAAFFARLVVIDGGGTAPARKYLIGEKRTGEVLFTGPAATQKPGQKGEPVGAKYLGGAALAEPPLPKDYKEPALKGVKELPRPDFSRKQKLADWLTAPSNPYFARAVANRLWGQFLRHGLIHPVDNLSSKNKPSHPELLETLEKELIGRQFDVKWLIRELVSSKTYQLASAGPVAEPRWFEQARLRALSAEEMLAALRVASGFDAANRAAGVKPGAEKLPSALGEYFLRYFGSATDGRGDFQASLSERLFMNNHAGVRQMIQRRKGNLADSLLSSKAAWDAKVDQLYLAVLTRLPRPEERQRFVSHLTSGPPDPLVEEAIWVLLNSAEFRFNH